MDFLSQEEQNTVYLCFWIYITVAGIFGSSQVFKKNWVGVITCKKQVYTPFHALFQTCIQL